MIRLLCTLVIVAGSGEPPNAARHPGAIEVFRCALDETSDRNFDQWPDNWTRRHGPGYPHYVAVKIQPEAGPGGTGCLQIDLDGGAAAALSPPVPIDPECRYLLEAAGKTKGLKHDRAFLSLSFLDEKKRPLETIESSKWAELPAWTALRLGPVCPRHEQARYAVIGLHLEPQSQGGFEDLRGRAAFADVWLARLPRVALGTGRRSNLFAPSEPVEVVARLSGLPAGARLVAFELQDVFGRVLAHAERPLATSPPPGPAEKTPAAPGTQQIAWKLPLPGPGFYRVRAGVKGLVESSEESLTLAVIEPLAKPARSLFGWSLPRADQNPGFDALGALLSEAGAGWVKVSAWSAPGDSAQIDALASLAERLEVQGIRTVGVFSDPPPEVRKRMPGLRSVTAADVFTSAPENWQDQVEPIMARLAGQLRWWQLGDDRDMSFVGYPDLPAKLQQARSALARLGGEMAVGIPWSWLEQPPPGISGPAGCQFLALRADPGLSPQELSAYLAALGGSPLRRFVDLQPLARARYPLEVRAADLVQSMIAAKVHGADAVFVSDPFRPEHALLTPEGTPSELFLPWRTAALLLADAENLGSLELMSGSRNHVFARDREALLVAWSERPVQETVYLGQEVRQIDLWGRPGRVARGTQGQLLQLGRVPVFVTGLDLPIVRWSLDLGLACSQIPSICDRPHQNALRLKSHFEQTVTGRAVFIAPEGWAVQPRQFNFRLAHGESLEWPFHITLLPDATSGRQPLRIDFELQADRLHRFSVLRALEVGLDDVSLEVRTRLNAQGDLEVEQRLTNRSDRAVSFRCQLFAPGRQLQRSDVLNLAPGRAVRTYLLSDGAELLGRKLWVRAEEIDGPRTLNSRFIAER